MIFFEPSENGDGEAEIGTVAATATRQERAGTHALSLFCPPLNGLVIRALADCSLSSTELREAVGLPAPTTLRGNLENLVTIGVLEPRRRDEGPQRVENALTPLGRELLVVADAIDAWLVGAPRGPLELGGSAAKAALRALLDGWDAAIVRALAARSLTLAELDTLIPQISYPTLARRLAAMRLTCQVERIRLEGRWVYRATDWLRKAIVPLGLAARAEHRHLHGVAPPITSLEVETAFLLALPLVKLPTSASGECTLAVDTRDPSVPSGRSRIAGARVGIRDGQVVSCSTRLLTNPPTWALGTAESWLDAVVDGRLDGLRSGGEEPTLPAVLVDAIRDTMVTPALAVHAA